MPTSATGDPLEEEHRRGSGTLPEAVLRLVEHIEAAGLVRVDLPREYSYSSLPLCVVDAVFSIGVRYTSVTATIDRFCTNLGWRVTSEPRAPRERGEHTIAHFLALSEGLSPEQAAEDLFGNRQRTSSRSGILKAQAVRLFASALFEAGIDDFGNLNDTSLLLAEASILGIPGQGSGISFDYFRMLAGDDDLIKPDRMVQRFVCAAADLKATTPTPRQTAILVRLAARELARRGQDWSPRRLDYAIWVRERNQRV